MNVTNENWTLAQMECMHLVSHPHLKVCHNILYVHALIWFHVGSVSNLSLSEGASLLLCVSMCKCCE